MPGNYDIKDEYGRKVGELEEKTDSSEMVLGFIKLILFIIGIACLPIWWGIYMVYKGWAQQPIGRKVLWVLSCFVLALVYFIIYKNDPSNVATRNFSIFYVVLGIIGIPLALKINQKK